jgi:ABC-type antimicrobial peptide transport system permease subunit
VLAALGGIDPRLPAAAFVIPMETGPVEIQKMMAQAPAVAATILGTLALVLAAVGVFGLVWQLVTRRTREIAIRMALGANRRDVARLVLWQTLQPVALGASLGLAGAVAISALLAAMVVAPDLPDLTYGVGAFHPFAFCGALAVLAIVVMAACLGPLRVAARVAPADALRME